MDRLDVYTAVHKMQRSRIFRLIVDAGTTDPDDALGRAQLAAAAQALVAELVSHAEHEDRFIHPQLRAKAPTVAASLDAEHEALDAKLRDVARLADTYAAGPESPNDLYRALARFAAAYLEHLAREEGEALPVLWGACSDDELVGILVSFRSARSDAENLTSLLAELKTLNPPEIARMLSVGLGPVQPTELDELLATLLSPRQLGAVRALASSRS